MKTKRLKVNAINYEGLKHIVESNPKYSKGNDVVREAMNISVGTWSYLRRSTSYEHFKELQMRDYVPKPKVEQPQLPEEPADIPRVDEPLEITPPPVWVATSNEMVSELKVLNKTLIRLCVAWESAPTKKSWLK